MIIPFFLAVLFGTVSSSYLVGQVGGVDHIMMTGDGRYEKNIADEFRDFQAYCETKGYGEKCRIGLALIKRAEVWDDRSFDRLPTASDAAAITYFSLLTPFKHIFLRASIEKRGGYGRFRDILWHEMAHAVFDAEHDDSHPNLMNTGWEVYEKEMSRISWPVKREQLFRDYGFGGPKVYFICNQQEILALGIFESSKYCLNF